jgi:hypothetical protein
MKRIILFLIGFLIVGALNAQSSNWYRYQFKLHGGLKVGNTIESTGVTKTGSLLLVTDSITTDNLTTPTLFKIYSGATQLIPDIPAAGSLQLFDYAVRKYADTLLVTDAAYTLVLADDGRIIRANRASQVTITVPPYSDVAFPVESVINFKMDAAGIVTFKAGSGVVLDSKNDSLSINVTHGWATLIKRAEDKWDLFGDLQD